MRRGTLLKVAAAVIVIVLTGSSAWGAETWQQLNVSRGNFESVRSAAQTLLRNASHAGLSHPVTQSFNRRIAATTVDSPSSPSSWTGAIDRYNRAKQTLLAVQSRIRSELRRETADQRTAAAGELKTLDGAIRRASRYNVATQDISGRYKQLEVAERRASTPVKLALVAKSARSALAALAQTATPTETFVDNLVKSSGGSEAGVVSSVRATVAAIDAKLSLLGVLTSRATFYRTQETADLAAVQRAPTAFRSAVAAYKLDSLRATVFADFTKTIPNKLIVVSTEQQGVTLYENGRSIYSTVATTGGPELPTFHGVYHIYEKISPFVFHSPFPPSSPYYYYPSPVTYWMPFDGGQGLHDAPWRSNFGPGSNLEPTDLGGGRSILGTHGCVNLPFDAAQFVWNWAPLGTTVAVI